MSGSNDPLRGVSTRATPQRERVDARQVRNDAGGYVYELDALARLRRFLTLGVDGGTFYVSAREVTRDNAQVVLELARTRGAELIREIVEVSESGRAPKNQPALFALAVAIAHGDVETRRAAADALPRVARTGTHLMQFNTYVRQFRGRGRVLDRAIENWYLKQSVGRLAYQVVKYRQREGWTHRDLLRLAKPKAAADDALRRVLFDWICHRTQRTFAFGTEDELRVVAGFEHAQRATNARGWADCVELYGLPWEALPTQALNERAVWEALLDVGVPQTALMRQLPRLTNLGLLPPRGGRTDEIVTQLTDVHRLVQARVHPINVLVAQRTYAAGHGERGSLTWTPTQRVADALDTAFYAAFGSVRRTNKRLRLALDVSGSMSWANVSGLPLTPRDVAGVMALVTANVEPDHEIVGFSHTLVDVRISPRQRLDDALRVLDLIPMGGTDCALPMLDAERTRTEVDAFFIYTDDQTWAGGIHVPQALNRYRERLGIPAALCSVGMTATRFTVGDPRDARTLSVAGFDASTPHLLADFAAGDL